MPGKRWATHWSRGHCSAQSLAARYWRWIVRELIDSYQKNAEGQAERPVQAEEAVIAGRWRALDRLSIVLVHQRGSHFKEVQTCASFRSRLQPMKLVYGWLVL